jgi:hypothetical protein
MNDTAKMQRRILKTEVHPSQGLIERSKVAAVAGANLGVEMKGFTLMPAGPLLIRAGGIDWAMGPAETDPHLLAGSLAIPDATRRDIEQINAAMAFDDYWIAHELKAGAVEKVDTTRLQDPKVYAQLIGAPPTAKVAGMIARRADALVADFKAARTRTAMAARAATWSWGDPALFGFLTENGSADPGTPAAVFLLAAWRPD